jgi:flagellar biosynthetic protein FliR
MSPTDIALMQFETFILILIRCSGLFIFAPFFSSEIWPPQVRAMGSLVLAWTVYMGLPHTSSLNVGQIGALPYMVFMELMISFMIGFSAKLLLNGTLIAGSLMGNYIGFSMISSIDPFSDEENNVLAQMYYMFAILLFVISGGHHLLIRILALTFEVIPLGGFTYTQASHEYLLEMSNKMWIVGIELSAPVLITMTFVTIGLGLLAKAVPQMNIFAVGFLIKIFIGLVVLLFTLEYSIDYMQDLFLDMQTDLINLIKFSRPPT